MNHCDARIRLFASIVFFLSFQTCWKSRAPPAAVATAADAEDIPPTWVRPTPLKCPVSS